MARNYTEQQIRNILADGDIVSTKVFELLPEVVKMNDPDKILQGYFQAVQDEYNRNKQSITDVLVLLDPTNVNRDFILEGAPVFFHPEQFIVISDSSSNTLVFNGTPPGVLSDDFYNGFGVYVYSDPTEAKAQGQYRRVISYDGTTKTATVDLDWSIRPKNGAVIALCWPDRIWIPTEIVADPTAAEGTNLPDQFDTTSNLQVKLPNLFYISDRDNYYNGWSIKFLDGNNAGDEKKIVRYVGDSSDPEAPAFTAILDSPPRFKPEYEDWFKLIPPSDSTVSNVNDYYKDRWITHVSGPTDTKYLEQFPFRAETRKILRSEYNPNSFPASHICYISDEVTGEGDRWSFPVEPGSYYGISNHFVSLNYLARKVGFELDALDPEELQREQIRQAFNFYKLKGTRRSIELICRAFGIEPVIQEVASNYVPDPPKVDVGPGTCTRPHRQYPFSTVQPRIERGFGEDGISPALKNNPGTQDRARIPDSDLRIFLSRINPNIFFDGTILQRIISKIEEVRPIHVEIILVGFAETFTDQANLSELFELAGTFQYEEPITITEGFLRTPIGTVVVPLDTEALDVNSFLLITSEARYDILDDIVRYDQGLPVTNPTIGGTDEETGEGSLEENVLRPVRGIPRFEIGIVYHEGEV